jgi:hypothetical protein
LESWIARHERSLTLGIFAVAALLQLNRVLHHGYMGQDWHDHASNAARAIEKPPFQWFVYAGTNPPGLYWLSAFVHWAIPATRTLALATASTRR